MPFEKKGRAYQYDPEAVADWLVKKGHAERQTWLYKWSDVHKRMGVRPRTTQDWKENDPTFPYYEDREGPWCLEVIQKWHVEVKMPRSGVGGSKSIKDKLGVPDKPPEPTTKDLLAEELLKERREKIRLSNEEKAGKLVEVALVAERMEKVTIEIRRELDERIGVIMSKLPAGTSDTTKRRIERVLRTENKVIRRKFAEILRLPRKQKDDD